MGAYNIKALSVGTILKAIPNPACVHDKEGRILGVNRAFVQAFGLSNDPSGRYCSDIIPWSQAAETPCPMLENGTSNSTIKTQVADAKRKTHFVVVSSPLILGEGFSGIMHSFTDIGDICMTDPSHISQIEKTKKTLRAKETELQDSRDAFFNMLEDISESYTELEDMFMSLLRAMVGALDAKSAWTRGHSERVARFTESIARAIGLDDDQIHNMHLSGLLHDIGKIGTYDALLDKPGKLTPEEFEIIKKHPAQGAQIIQNIKQLREIVPYIRHHHERYDGLGYPDGLKGDEIPLQARILHAADSFDAMTASRPYREAPGVIYAMKEMERYSGIQFDPDVAHAFLALVEKNPGLFL